MKPILAILAALLLVGSATPRSGSDGSLPNMAAVDGGEHVPPPVHLALSGAPHPLTSAGLWLVGSNRRADASRERTSSGAPQPAVASAAIPMPAQNASAATWEGTLAYALPSYGPLYLAIRQPRGSRVVVCGPAACLTRISTDFGPSPWMARQGRIADVSAADFTVLCGVPLSFGLCPGTVTLAGLPATDVQR